MDIIGPLSAQGSAPLTGIGGAAQVRTPVGPRRIENLREGDLVVTRDAGLQPVRMVWQQTIGADYIATSLDNAPVSIAPRTFGPMMPQTRVVLAPGQKTMLPGHLLNCDVRGPGGLIEARALAGTSDLVWFDYDAIDQPFFNVVFDSHQVICVSGLPVESYRPTVEGMRHLDAQLRLDISRRFPLLREKQPAYAPVPLDTVCAQHYVPAA